MLQPTRTLIIEDDPDYEGLLRSVLREGFDVMSTSTLAGGLTRLEHATADVILLDLNLPDSAGYATFLRVCDVAGKAAIIVLTGENEEQLAVKALEDGAQEYLVKNTIQPEMLPRYVRMALGRQSRSGMPRRPGKAGLVLGFIGSKGGVGTSTVAVNFAALLAHSGSEATLVELRGGPGASSLYMQTQPTHDLSWLLESPGEAITATRLQQCACEPVLGLRLISPRASTRTSRAVGAEQARDVIAAARRLGTHVVLDLPSYVDEGTAAALGACDSVCLVVDREPSSVHCALAVLHQIGAVNTRGAGVSLVEVERTRLDDRFPPSDLRRLLQSEPLVTIRPAAAAIGVSHSARIPLVSLYPKDPFSLSICELAARLLTPVMQWECAEPYRQAANSKSYWRVIPETAYS